MSSFESIPLGYCVSEVRRKNLGGQEQNLLSLSYGRIIRKDIESVEGLLPESFDTYNIVEPGDTVLRLTDLQNDQRSLRVGIVEERGIITSAYVTVRPTSRINERFLNYFLKMMDFRKDFYALGAGVRQSLKFEELRRVQVAVPDIAAQRAIADYLDTETARIDALIAKKQRMIELIEMRRKVVVVEHVSGHDSDGGVRLRHVSRLVRGSGFPHEYQGLDDGDLPFFKVGDLSRPGNDPYLVSCGNWVSAATANSLRATVVPPGAVMFPKIGAALAGGVRRIATVPSVCDNNVLAVVPTGVEERYLRFWLSTVDLAEIANPGPVPSLDDDALKDLLVPVADRERQGEIADRLDVATASMSNAVTRIQSQIGLLRERRQALITAVVTGELEIPGVAA